MVKVIDENHIITEEGVELVAVPKFGCGGCYYADKKWRDCSDQPLPCIRDDGISVIYVECSHKREGTPE